MHYERPAAHRESGCMVLIAGVEFRCYPADMRMQPTLARFVDATLAIRLERESKSDAKDTPLLGDLERRISAALGCPVMLRVVF